MRKPFRFDEKGRVICEDCGNPIKKNVLARRGLLEVTGRVPGVKCNSCHHISESGRGHFMGKFGRPRKKMQK